MSTIFSIILIVLVSYKFLSSFINENFIVLKIIKSATIPPIPPMSAAKKIFDGCEINKNPTANGAENPNEINIPERKIPMEFTPFNFGIRFETPGFLNIK